MVDVEIVEAPRLQLVCLPHRGPYAELSRTFDRLFGTLEARRRDTTGLRCIAIFYDNPRVVAPADLRSWACVALDPAVPVEPPLERIAIGGGPYARLCYLGPYGGLPAVYDWLFDQWLPGSGRTAAAAPSFEDYRNSPHDTPPAGLRTDIYLPLQPA